MRRILSLPVAAGLLLLHAAPAPAAPLLEGFEWSTRTRLESAVAVHAPVAQKMEARFEPTLEAHFAGGFDLVGIGRLRSDFANELRPDNPEEVELWKPSRSARFGDYTQLSLRELYLQRRFGPMHVILGKQQVVWGTSDGIKVLDLVNPQDFREFILEDYVDSRLPTWMLNVTAPLGPFQAQLLWIPDRSYAELAPPGSVYELRSPQFVPEAPAGLPVSLRPVHRPSDWFEDSEAGLRLKSSIGAWDFTLNYLYAFEDVPIPYHRLDFGTAGPELVVEPSYRRTHYVGGTVNRTIGDWVLRSEAAVSTDHYVYTEDPSDSDGVRSGSETNTVVGLDWFGLRDTLLSVQMFTRYTQVDHDADCPQAGWTLLPTFLARRSMFGDRVVAQIFWLQDIGRGDGLLRTSLRWELRDSFTVMLGSDTFYGSSKGIFGEFEDATRFVFGLESTI